MRQNPADPNRLFIDFDPAGPGGKGGASMRIDLDQGTVSIDGVHKNVLLPPRSTGALLAEGLLLFGMVSPACIEAYNVETTTAGALAAGSQGQGSLIGNLLEDTAKSLGGAVIQWEPIREGSSWHLRVHIDYP